MLYVRIISTDKDKISEHQDKLCHAMAGTPAYIGVEICISNVSIVDENIYGFDFIIGNDNNHDLKTTLCLDTMQISPLETYKIEA